MPSRRRNAIRSDNTDTPMWVAASAPPGNRSADGKPLLNQTDRRKDRIAAAQRLQGVAGGRVGRDRAQVAQFGCIGPRLATLGRLGPECEELGAGLPHAHPLLTGDLPQPGLGRSLRGRDAVRQP